MKNILTIFLILITNIAVSQDIRVSLIDTVELNQFNIDRLEEINDCTVRAISEGFDIPYLDALVIMEKMGRRRRGGVSLKAYIRGTQIKFVKEILYSANLKKPMKAKEFVNTIAEDGYTYIVISHAHTFVIEQGGVGMRWYVKGNYDDRKKEILMYFKVKNNYER